MDGWMDFGALICPGFGLVPLCGLDGGPQESQEQGRWLGLGRFKQVFSFVVLRGDLSITH